MTIGTVDVIVEAEDSTGRKYEFPMKAVLKEPLKDVARAWAQEFGYVSDLDIVGLEDEKGNMLNLSQSPEELGWNSPSIGAIRCWAVPLDEQYAERLKGSTTQGSSASRKRVLDGDGAAPSASASSPAAPKRQRSTPGVCCPFRVLPWCRAVVVIMSRALTIYRRSDKEKDPEVDHVMEKMGCSEPVARNMLKMRKLGLGPLAGNADGMEEMRRSPPRIAAGAAIQADKKRRLQEQEQRLREQEDFALFERVEKAPKQTRQVAGMARLGPVSKREEQIDPLEKKAVLPEPVEEEEAAEEKEQRERLKAMAEKTKQDAFERRFMQERHEREEEARRRQGKKKRKRRRGEDAGSDDSEAGLEGEHVRDAKVINPAHKKARSPSPHREPAHKGAERSSSSGGLMTEEEILARMGKEKKTERGSYRAASRIQKEWEEWERQKANNAEYNKAPRFALCFSAETGKNKRY